MAAPLRNKMLLINAPVKVCCIVSRNARGSLISIPVNGVTARKFSQLHKCTRLHTARKKSDCLSKVYVLSALRHASTGVQETEIPAPPEIPSGFMPDRPMLPEDVIPNLPDLNALGEPTLKSLGLGSNWPVGLYQKAVEYLHVHIDIPWWTAIICSVIVIRLLVFPVMIKQQRTMGGFDQHKKKLTKLQDAYDAAKLSQDPIEIMKRSHELQLFLKDKKMNPIYLATPLLFQGPVFISVFMGLRKMSELPVDSMSTGGLAWFTDLTVPDPFFILPIIGATALLLNFEMGAETLKASSMKHGQKWLLRGSSVVFLVLMSFTPAATGVYFCTNNALTIVQAMALRRPKVREYFTLPPKTAEKKPVDTKGFTEGFKEYFKKNRQQKEIINRRYTDEERFKKAGTGPVPKTYAYNPKASTGAV